MDKCAIINESKLLRKIEECNRSLTFVNEQHDIPYQKEIDVLQQLLSESTSLIPEIVDKILSTPLDSE